MEDAWSNCSQTFAAVTIKSRADSEDQEVWQNAGAFSFTNARMLETGDITDVMFLMGESKKEIRAHKYMLVSRSCVFHAMFCGPLARPGESVVEIPDIEHDVMAELLRFMYTTECQLSTDTVMAVMYAAKKYDVPSLMERCLVFLKAHLTPENVCIILKQAHMLSEQDLIRQCMIVIFQNAEAVLESEGFLCLDKDIVGDILKAEFLVEEELLYKACIRWADDTCRKLGKEVTDLERRNILGDLLYLIRFPCMTPDSFTSLVSKSDVLLADEKVCVFEQYIERNGVCKFVCNPRVHYTKYVVMTRFHNHQSVLVWQDSHDEIQFMSSEAVNLAGVGLFLPVSGRKFQALLEVTRKGSVLETKKIVPHVDNVPYVMLDKRVPIEKEVNYGLALTVSYSEPHQHVTYGVEGQAVVKCGNLVVTFSDMEKSDCTDVRKGQFKCIVLEF